jgi:hypothetical protein
MRQKLPFSGEPFEERVENVRKIIFATKSAKTRSPYPTIAPWMKSTLEQGDQIGRILAHRENSFQLQMVCIF